MDAILYYIKICLTSKYFNFHGRASRREYWVFTIISTIFGGLILAYINELKASYEVEGDYIYVLIIGLLGLTLLYLVVPNISVTVRRLHDIGKSGWWLLLDFIPTIGEIILLIMCLTPSQPFDNQYGRYNTYLPY